MGGVGLTPGYTVVFHHLDILPRRRRAGRAVELAAALQSVAAVSHWPGTPHPRAAAAPLPPALGLNELPAAADRREMAEIRGRRRRRRRPFRGGLYVQRRAVQGRAGRYSNSPQPLHHRASRGRSAGARWRHLQPPAGVGARQIADNELPGV